jgi:hypothetical protein
MNIFLSYILQVRYANICLLFADDIAQLRERNSSGVRLALEPSLRLLLVRIRKANEIVLTPCGAKEGKSERCPRCRPNGVWPGRLNCSAVRVKAEWNGDDRVAGNSGGSCLHDDSLAREA